MKTRNLWASLLNNNDQSDYEVLNTNEQVVLNSNGLAIKFDTLIVFGKISLTIYCLQKEEEGKWSLTNKKSIAAWVSSAKKDSVKDRTVWTRGREILQLPLEARITDREKLTKYLMDKHPNTVKQLAAKVSNRLVCNTFDASADFHNTIENLVNHLLGESDGI